MYATLAQARDAGASGTDAEVTAAISRAQQRVDTYTGAVWEPTTTTVAAHLGPSGAALLPYQVRPGATYTVRPQDGTVDLPATAYRMRSSAVPGDVDALELGAGHVSDPLVLGAEPWAGGFPNLFGRLGLRQGRVVYVSGMWGPDAPPPEVQAATALLAALLQGSGQAGTSLDVDAEGRSLTSTTEGPAAPEPPPAPGAGRRTTGYPTVDGILAPLVRRPVRFG